MTSQTEVRSGFQGETINVDIADFKFALAKITVKKGTSVTWVNKDSIGHTVTGDKGGPSSGLLSQGQSYSYTFTEAGTFDYHCKPHPFIKGLVEVLE